MDKPVKLDGFAPAAGTGATGAAGPPAPAPSASAPSGGATPAAVAAPATKPPTAKRPKRGPGKKGGAAAKSETHAAEDAVVQPLSAMGSAAFAPLSLSQVRLRLRALLDALPPDLPAAPPAFDAADDGAAAHAARRREYAPLRAFASALQVATEEYNLLLGLVSCATYRRGVDRSGASTQNLSVMSGELQQCQDVIANIVSARLSNVLCPAVELLVGEVEIVKGETSGEETGDAAAPSSSPTPAKKRKLDQERPAADGAARRNGRRINYTRDHVDGS